MSLCLVYSKNCVSQKGLNDFGSYVKFHFFLENYTVGNKKANNKKSSMLYGYTWHICTPYPSPAQKIIANKIYILYIHVLYTKIYIDIYTLFG